MPFVHPCVDGFKALERLETTTNLCLHLLQQEAFLLRRTAELLEKLVDRPPDDRRAPVAVARAKPRVKKRRAAKVAVQVAKRGPHGRGRGQRGRGRGRAGRRCYPAGRRAAGDA